MKTKKEKLKQNNLSSKKKNRVANQNNKRNKTFRDWSRKKHDQKKLFCVAKFYQRSKKTFLRSEKFISVAKKIS